MYRQARMLMDVPPDKQKILSHGHSILHGHRVLPKVRMEEMAKEDRRVNYKKHANGHVSEINVNVAKRKHRKPPRSWQFPVGSWQYFNEIGDADRFSVGYIPLAIELAVGSRSPGCVKGGSVQGNEMRRVPVRGHSSIRRRIPWGRPGSFQGYVSGRG